MADAPKHKGITITVGDRELVMPRLTCGPLKRHWPAVTAARKKTEDDGASALPEMLSAQVGIIHAALERNYPELTLEQLEDELELGQVSGLFVKLMALSNVEKVPAGATTGEAESPKS